MAQAQLEAGESAIEHILLRQLARDVRVRLSDPLDLSPLASSSNLLAISNQNGALIAATTKGFIVHPLSSIRNLFISSERNSDPTLHSPAASIDTLSDPRLASRVNFLRIANNEFLILVGFENGRVAAWDIQTCLQSGNSDPTFVIEPPSADLRLIELSPNPSDRPELSVAIYAQSASTSTSTDSGTAIVLDVVSGNWGSQLQVGQECTSACWSVKGKQIALGLTNGEIMQITPEGEQKDKLPRPDSLDSNNYVLDIKWLENHVFCVTYNQHSTSTSGPDEDPTHEENVFMILRDTKSSPPLTFVQYQVDPSPAFGDTSRKSKRFSTWLKGWNPTKHLIFIGNSPSSDIGLIGFAKGKGQIEPSWQTLELEEISKPVLPFTKSQMETGPVGIELDLSSQDGVPDPSAAARGEDENTKLDPMPVLMIYTTDGILVAYHVINVREPKPGVKQTKTEVEIYPGMIHSSQPQIPSSSTSNPTTSEAPTFSTPSNPTSTQPQPTAPSAQAPTPFSFASASTSSPSAPAFGQSSAFGSGSTGFGQTSAFGSQSAVKSAFASANSPSSGGFGAFGGSKPTTFGGASTTAFSFGSSPSASTPNAANPSTTSAFGSTSGFGTAASGSPSVFGGTSAFGQSAAGNNQSQQDKSATPTFNAPPSGSAFGGFASKTSAFGAAPTTSIFGSSTPKESKPTPSTAFSSPAASAFGMPVKPSMSLGPVLSEKEKRAEEEEKRIATESGAAGGGFSLGGMDNMLGGSESGENEVKSEDQDHRSEPEYEDDVEDEPRETFKREQIYRADSGDEDVTDGRKLSSDSTRTRSPTPEPQPPATNSLSFGGSSAAPSNVGFGSATPSFSFGGFGNNANKATSAFGNTSGTASPTGFSFGTSANNFSFGKSDEKTEEAPKSAFSFGSQPEKKEESPKSKKRTQEDESEPAPTKFSFGKKEEEVSSSTPADDSSAKAEPTPQDQVASEPEEDSKPKSALPFGNQDEDKSKPTFSFGQQSAEDKPKSAFSFGNQQEETKPKAAFSFGNQAENKSSSSFSFGSSKPAESKPDTSASQDEPSQAPSSAPTFAAPPAGGFSFGGVQPAAIKSSSSPSTQASKGPSFAQAPAGGFSFGKVKEEESDEDEDGDEDEGQVHDLDQGEVEQQEREYDLDQGEVKQQEREEIGNETENEGREDERREQNQAEGQEQYEKDDVAANQQKTEEEEDERPQRGDETKRRRESPKPAESEAPKSQPFSFGPAPTSSSTPKFSFGPTTTSQGEQPKVSAFSFGPSSNSSATPSSQPQSTPFSFNPTPSTTSSGSTTAPASTSTSTATPAAPSSNNAKFSFGTSSNDTKNGGAQKGGFQNFNARVPRSSSPLAGAPVNRGDLDLSPEKKEEEDGKRSKPSSFSGFGKPSQPTFAPAPQGGFSFGNKQPSAFASPSQSQSPLSQQQTPPQSQAPPAAQSNQPSGGFSFGSKQSQPTNSFSPVSSRPASPSVSQEVLPSTSPLPPPVARAPLAPRQPEAERERVTQSPFHDLQPPRFGSTVSAPDLSEIKETGMQGEFMRTYTIMEKELKEFQQNVARCKSFQHDLKQRTDRPPEDTSDFSDQALWTFDDLEKIVSLAQALEVDVSLMNDQTLEHRQKLAEIKSLGLKAEAKREEGERYIRALTDPVYANSIRTRELGPAHVENQLRLRKMRSAVKESLQALEDHLSLVKRKIQDKKLGRTPMKIPTLDSIQRSIRNISASAGAKIFDLDELSTSFDLLARHSLGRSVTPSASVPRYETGLGAFNLSTISASLSFEGQVKQPPHRAVASALESKRAAADLGAAWTAAQRRPILNKNAARETKVDEKKAKTYQFSDLQMSFAKGPVKLEKKSSPQPQPQPQSQPQAQAPFSSGWSKVPPAQASPSSVFGSGFNSTPSFSQQPNANGFGNNSSFNTAPASQSFSFPASNSFFNPGGREKEGSSSPNLNHRSSHTKKNRVTSAVPLPPPTTVSTTPSFSFGTPPSFGDSSKRTSPAPSNFFGAPPAVSFAGLQAPTPISPAPSSSASSTVAPPSRFDEAVAAEPGLEDEQEFEEDFEDESDGEWDPEDNATDEEGLSAVDEEEEEEEVYDE